MFVCYSLKHSPKAHVLKCNPHICISTVWWQGSERLGLHQSVMRAGFSWSHQWLLKRREMCYASTLAVSTCISYLSMAAIKTPWPSQLKKSLFGLLVRVAGGVHDGRAEAWQLEVKTESSHLEPSGSRALGKAWVLNLKSYPQLHTPSSNALPPKSPQIVAPTGDHPFKRPRLRGHLIQAIILCKASVMSQHRVIVLTK